MSAIDEGLLRSRTASALLRSRTTSALQVISRRSSSLGPSFSVIGDGGCVSSFGAPITSQRLGAQTSKGSFVDGRHTAISNIHGRHSAVSSQIPEDDAAQPLEPELEPEPELAKAYNFNSYALPTLHFAVGVLNNLQGVAWRQYLIHGACNGAGLDPADQALVGGVVGALPWNLKIGVAFTSDVLSCCGYRRKPYLFVGLLLQGGAWLLLGLLGRHATFQVIAAQQFCAVMGQMIVGVMCDTLVVENVGYERGAMVGRLQTNCRESHRARTSHMRPA